MKPTTTAGERIFDLVSRTRVALGNVRELTKLADEQKVNINDKEKIANIVTELDSIVSDLEEIYKEKDNDKN